MAKAKVEKASDIKYLIAGSVGDKLHRILQSDLEVLQNTSECRTLSKDEAREVLKKYE